MFPRTWYQPSCVPAYKTAVQLTVQVRKIGLRAVASQWHVAVHLAVNCTSCGTRDPYAVAYWWIVVF